MGQGAVAGGSGSGQWQGAVAGAVAGRRGSFENLFMSGASELLYINSPFVYPANGLVQKLGRFIIFTTSFIPGMGHFDKKVSSLRPEASG